MAFADIETNFRKHFFARTVAGSHDISDANNGIDDIVETQRPFAISHQVSFADL